MAPWGKASLFLAGLIGAQGARTRRKANSQTKVIAGVPVFNYQQAYNSKGSLAEGSMQDWVVVVTPGTSDEKIHELCIMSKCVREGHPSKGGMPYFEVRGSEAELQKVLESSEGVVKFVEPDAEVSMIPELEGQASRSQASWGLDRVAAPSRAREGDGVNVYVMDTGVRATHTDFGGRVIPALDMTGDTLVECKGAAGCAGDIQGHGTHCAGTAAGATFGVAPKATVRSIKVLSDTGSGSWSWSYDALDWLATKGEFPSVASMSLGGQGTQQAMATAVDVAVDAGVVVVVAGGNSNRDACGFSPAFVPSAITVGSTTSTDARSSFSNYGSCTEIWAPGSAIKSASHTSDGGARTLSGTSMACPHVSGAAALVLQAHPGWKSAAVLNELLDNAIENVITGLKTGDTNSLLYVGRD
jgi:subtilisin family serine protease